MDSDYGQQYADLYRKHWWWRVRERILLSILDRLPPQSRPRELLDFGCGDGLFFSELKKYGNVRGIEVDRTLITPNNPDRDQISPQPLGHADYQNWKFDVILALDVIEHLEDDVSAVSDLAGMLAPGGRLIITVPAFPLLWDAHDEVNHHYRRYTTGSLRKILPQGFRFARLQYLFSSLFPLKLAVKSLNRFRKQAVAQTGLPNPQVGKFMQTGLWWEYCLTKRLPIPFGTSVLAVLERSTD